MKLESSRVTPHIISLGKNQYIVRICLWDEGHAKLDSTSMEYEEAKRLADRIIKPHTDLEKLQSDKEYNYGLYSEKEFERLHFQGKIG